MSPTVTARRSERCRCPAPNRRATASAGGRRSRPVAAANRSAGRPQPSCRHTVVDGLRRPVPRRPAAANISAPSPSTKLTDFSPSDLHFAQVRTTICSKVLVTADAGGGKVATRVRTNGNPRFSPRSVIHNSGNDLFRLVIVTLHDFYVDKRHTC